MSLRGKRKRGFVAWLVWICRVVAYASIALFVLGGVAWATGARIVETPSIPRGLYWQIPGGSIYRGAVVAGCLPLKIARFAKQRGYELPGPCPGNTLPFAKVVAAIGGDHVIEDASGVRINGVLWPWSRPTDHDQRGQSTPWQRRNFIMPAGQMLVLGLNPESYDGRFFGPLPVSAMPTVYRPVWIEQNGYADRLRLIQREAKRGA